MIKYDLYDDFRSYVEDNIINTEKEDFWLIHPIKNFKSLNDIMEDDISHNPKENFDSWAMKSNSEYILKIAEKFINEKHLNVNPYKILKEVKDRCVALDVGYFLFWYYNVKEVIYKIIDYVSPLLETKGYELTKNDIWNIFLKIEEDDIGLENSMIKSFTKIKLALMINIELNFEAIRIYKTGKCKLTKIFKKVIEIIKNDKGVE